MNAEIITIPEQPIAKQSFLLNYNNPLFVPEYSTSINTNFILQDVNGNIVSDTFVNTRNGLSVLGINSNTANSLSYLINDSDYNYYYTNNISFSYTPGNYYVYIFNEIHGRQIFINDSVLTNECPIGLAIDSKGSFYVALQTTNKIIKYDTSDYIPWDLSSVPISSGTTIISNYLNGPCGLVFDSSGYLYVANRRSNNIVKFDLASSDLQIQIQIPIQIITNPNFLQPCAININNLGELFISNINSLLFKMDTNSLVVTEILDIPDRQSVNMTFDINNNIYLPDFNLVYIYKVEYGTWSYTSENLYNISPGGIKMNGVNMTKYGNLAIIRTTPVLSVDLKYLTYRFDTVTLPKGNNLLTLYNVTSNSVVTTFTVFVERAEPLEPIPEPIISFKEGTKILCKLNNQDSYIPIEFIEEGTLVKTYKYGYKKCKFNMKELLKNTESHNINNLYRLQRTINSQLFEDLYVTGSQSMLYDSLSAKEDEDMTDLLEIYNMQFNINMSNKIDDKYKLIAHYDNTFTEVRQNINVNIFHLVLENNNNNNVYANDTNYTNYGIYANGILTESNDEANLLLYGLTTGNVMITNIKPKKLGPKDKNKLTKFK
jgi:hypothetical protein